MNREFYISKTAASSILVLLLTLLSVGLFLTGCSTSGKTETMASPTATPAMTNGELEIKIKEKFRTDAQIEAWVDGFPKR